MTERSPIETLFEQTIRGSWRLGRPGLWLEPQFQIGRYRADFLLTMTTHMGSTAIVIELDGHEWHERTKEQAAHDRARDRAILAAGYPVVRFTGSEVNNDPLGCVVEATDIICEVFNRVVARAS